MPQTVFITGGTRGIGRKIAESFLDKAYNVAITFEKSEEIANEMKDKYKNLIAIKCDVAKGDEVKRAFEKCNEIFGGVDILINKC